MSMTLWSGCTCRVWVRNLRQLPKRPIGGDTMDPLRAPLRSKRGAGEWSGAQFTLKEPKWVGVESRRDSIGLAQHFWTYNNIPSIYPYTIVNINKTRLCHLKENVPCLHFHFYLFEFRWHIQFFSFYFKSNRWLSGYNPLAKSILTLFSSHFEVLLLDVSHRWEIQHN